MSWFYPNDRDLTNEDIESYAMACWEIMKALTDGDNHCKMYDPLTIEDKIAHSYVFDLEDGGRHHRFKTLGQLRRMILKETLERIKDFQKEEHNINLTINI